MTAPSRSRLTLHLPTLTLVLALVVVVLLFLTMPLPHNVAVGEDWTVFRSAALRLAHGNPHLYGVGYLPNAQTSVQYFNAPWLAAALIPLAILPERLGWALICTATLGLTIALLDRWNKTKPGRLAVLLALVSPPVVQIVIHGQVDALVVAAVFLPAEWWPLVVTAKPQAAFALVLGVPRAKWRRAALILGAALALSLALLGLWPRALHDAVTTDGVYLTRRTGSLMWLGQLVVGTALAIRGAITKDERLLISASPLLSPFAFVHSFFGLWIAALTVLDRRSALAAWVVFWAWIVLPKFL